MLESKITSNVATGFARSFLMNGFVPSFWIKKPVVSCATDVFSGSVPIVKKSNDASYIGSFLHVSALAFSIVRFLNVMWLESLLIFARSIVTSSASSKLSNINETFAVAFPAETSSMLKEDFSGLSVITSVVVPLTVVAAETVVTIELAIVVARIAADVRTERSLLFFITIFPFCLLCRHLFFSADPPLF